jgi:hypothetical protein
VSPIVGPIPGIPPIDLVPILDPAPWTAQPAPTVAPSTVHRAIRAASKSHLSVTLASPGARGVAGSAIPAVARPSLAPVGHAFKAAVEAVDATADGGAPASSAPFANASAGPDGGTMFAILAIMLSALIASRSSVGALRIARPISLSFAPAVPPA